MYEATWLAVPGCGVRRGTHSSLCVRREAENLIPEQAAFQFRSTAAAWPRCVCYCVPALSHLIENPTSFCGMYVLALRNLFSVKTLFYLGAWQCWGMNQWPHTAKSPHLVHGILQTKLVGDRLGAGRANVFGPIPSVLILCLPIKSFEYFFGGRAMPFYPHCENTLFYKSCFGLREKKELSI